MIITIDGLSINGKTTLAQMLSKNLGIKYFNTGAIYRVLALKILESNIDINDINKVIELFSSLNIDFIGNSVYLNNEDVTDKIYTDQIAYYSTKWGTITEIKEAIRNYQKEFIKNNDVIMEGRDIGSRIAPTADFKFYLYADFDKRVERMYLKNPKVDKKTHAHNLMVLDELDINGGNFVKPNFAYEIDTTDKSLDEVLKEMLKIIQEKREVKKGVNNMNNKLIHDKLNKIYDEAEDVLTLVKEKFPKAVLNSYKGHYIKIDGTYVYQKYYMPVISNDDKGDICFNLDGISLEFFVSQEKFKKIDISKLINLDYKVEIYDGDNSEEDIYYEGMNINELINNIQKYKNIGITINCQNIDKEKILELFENALNIFKI